MKFTIVFLLLLVGCATRPRTHITAPHLGSATRSVVDAKDYLSRARTSNEKIDAELKKLEDLLQ